LCVFGLCFVFGLPPGQGADEPSHFPRAYHISEGHLFPVMQNNWEWGGGSLPVALQRVIDAFFHVGNRTDLRVEVKKIEELWQTPLRLDDRIPVMYPTAAHYTFVPYLPQALGIALARTAGLGPLPVFYAGRLANLLLCVVLFFWAIRLWPVGRLAFGMITLLPITVQQCATYTPDAATLSAAFLLLALLLRLALRLEPPAGVRTMVLLLSLTAWLALCKVPYVLLLLLYLAVPMSQLGGWKRYLVTAVGMAAVVLCCLPLINHGRNYVPNRINGNREVAIDKQLEFIRTHPVRYTKIVAASVAVYGQLWFDQLGYLGWLETKVNPLALHLYLLVLLLVALGDPTGRAPVPGHVKLLALAASVACFVMIVTACYLCGCVPGAKLIDGPQGRYFLPLLPLLLLTLSNRAIRVHADARVLLSLAAASGAAILLVSVATLVWRYYLPALLELRVEPVALIIAGTVAASSVALARWRWRPVLPVEPDPA
jgi:uncharacterized membrane protein